MVANLIFRLTIWFLLTANFSVANIFIGFSVALLLPGRSSAPERIGDWWRSLGKILTALSQAYLEAFEMLIRPHNQEDIVIERVPEGRSPRLIFLDIFLITFTPKTIVFDYRPGEGYYVHRVRRRKPE